MKRFLQKYFLFQKPDLYDSDLIMYGTVISFLLFLIMVSVSIFGW